MVQSFFVRNSVENIESSFNVRSRKLTPDVSIPNSFLCKLKRDLYKLEISISMLRVNFYLDDLPNFQFLSSRERRSVHKTFIVHIRSIFIRRFREYSVCWIDKYEILFVLLPESNLIYVGFPKGSIKIPTVRSRYLVFIKRESRFAFRSSNCEII